MIDLKPRIRLLYIDDDRGLSRLVQKELERHGYAVTCVPDGDAGLEALAADDYDVCALDHYMPGRDGLDVLPDILALPSPLLAGLCLRLDGRTGENLRALRWLSAQLGANVHSVQFRTFVKAYRAAVAELSTKR